MTKDINEDAPTNNASSGAVDGLGNNPPVGKKKKLRDIIKRKPPNV